VPDLTSPLPADLRRMAERAACDPAFLAAALGSSTPAAATRLRCSERQAYHLALCPMPGTDAECDGLAARFGVDAGELREVLAEWRAVAVPAVVSG
jgi:hypothetical protein